jgi:tetratricopeptide (TPR) repeat protein
MDARIGDMLLAAGHEDRAIAAYETVLASSPDRKDVSKKVADYYVGKGNGLLQDGRLEDARDAFAAAAKANPLHPEAEAKRLEAEGQIAARDSRQTAHRDALGRADELRAMAEQEAARSYYAEAISFLQQAEVAYLEVTDEFPSEAQQRTRGLRDVRDLLTQWKQALKGSAPTYSGRGFTEDLKSAVQDGMKGLEQEALAEMADKAHVEEIARLTQEMQPQLAIP